MKAIPRFWLEFVGITLLALLAAAVLSALR